MSESPKSSGPDGAGANEAHAAAEGSRRQTGERPAAESPNDEGTPEVSTTEDQGSTAVQEPGTTEQPQAAPESTAPDSENTARTPDGGAARPTAKAVPKSLTFHLTRTSLLAVAVVAVCTTPIAFAQPFPYLLPAFLIPAALAYAVLWPRTIATDEGIRTRLLAGETSFGWDELASVRLNERRWVRAVLESGGEGRTREVRLSAVRVRDLSHLALMSGGRLPDPNEPLERPAETGAVSDGEQGTGSANSESDSAAESADDTGKSTAAQQDPSAAASESAPGEDSPDDRRG